MQRIEVDGGGVVHDIGIVLSGKDVSGPAHVGGKLVDLIDPIHHIRYQPLIAQVSHDELIGWRSR